VDDETSVSGYLARFACVEWSSVAVAQNGVITRAQLLEQGIDDGVVTSMSVDGRLRRQAPGVFLVRGAPLTDLARLWVATLATEGVLGFATAARLWGVGGTEPVTRVHVVVPHGRRVYPPRWVRLHRVPIAAGHIVVRDGLPMTSRPWTLCDYLPTLTEGASVTLLDRALQQRWITPADIAARLREYPKRRGNTRLRLLLDLTGDGAAAKSERILHALLRQANIEGWRPNYPVRFNAAVIAAVDVAFVERRLAIEVDGMAFHIGADRFQGDRTRQNDLIRAGWTVLRFTWADISYRPDYVVASIRAILHSPNVGSFLSARAT
jgi:very-short-patch-repair endonuclease/predicted transcriptional regulator of viral defense system